MFKSLFSKNPFQQNKEAEKPQTPSIMGLGIGFSFELDPLFLRLLNDHLVTKECSTTYIIQAAGIVEMDDTSIYRFYTDDEAFLQVVAQGGNKEEHVIDVKLYHYYDTIDVSSDTDWDQLLYKKIGAAKYELEGHQYSRVWNTVGEYHQPVHMMETTFDDAGDRSTTDQFTMLFERPILEDQTESLFLSAEETEDPPGSLSRCFVMSTGISLSPTQITIHGTSKN